MNHGSTLVSLGRDAVLLEECCFPRRVRIRIPYFEGLGFRG